jgi:hypothetical protein
MSCSACTVIGLRLRLSRFLHYSHATRVFLLSDWAEPSGEFVANVLAMVRGRYSTADSGGHQLGDREHESNELLVPFSVGCFVLEGSVDRPSIVWSDDVGHRSGIT